MQDAGEDQTSRIQNWYATNGKEPLSDEEHEIRKRAEVIFGMFLNNSKAQIKKFIHKAWGISESHAYYLIRQSEQIFGVAQKSDKEGLRAAQTARYEQIAMNAESDQDKLKALERIDKINHLEDRAPLSINIEKLLALPVVERTTDPAALNIDHLQDE